MTTANSANNNLSPWQPGQSGNPSGRPKGTRDLAGYVLETTDGGKELVDALVSIARGVIPNVAVQECSRPRKDQQVRPTDQLKAIEMLPPSVDGDAVVLAGEIGAAISIKP